MNTDFLLWALLVSPVVFGLASLTGESEKRSLLLMLAGVGAQCFFASLAIIQVFSSGPVIDASGWLRLDALSAYHLMVMLVVYGGSSLFAWVYFISEMNAGYLRLGQVKTFTSLWCPAMSAMALVLISNNLGMMWIGIEATTLLTAFLICIHMSRGVLEAMWKYLVICSVGTALAFLGTLFLIVSAHDLGFSSGEALLWTNLLNKADQLDPMLTKAAFIFILVGYGTKAGLAPMHSWLPDAHSKAPAPVSALFSGFMLNAALYCVMRFIPLVNIATGNVDWPLGLLLGFGMVSIIVAAAYVLFQSDVKRLLAYCSVEHLGIIALGLGIGGLGTMAALFHTLNHSFSKALSFFAAGRLGQFYGSHEMKEMPGGLKVSPIWGGALIASFLALIGVAPFSVFMSEFQILKAAVDKNMLLVLSIFIIGTASIFIGMLQHAIPLAWGEQPDGIKTQKGSLLEAFIVLFPLVILLLLGIWMPEPFRIVLEKAAEIIQGKFI